MEQPEKIDAMEKGQATTPDQSIATSPSDASSQPSPIKTVFSWRSSKSLFPTLTLPRLSRNSKIFSSLRKTSGAHNPTIDTGSSVFVRPVHGVNGYPTLAAYLDSDDNFMVYRRFGYVQARLLLDKQERLRGLEADLDELDQEQVQNPDRPDLLCKAIIGGEHGRERKRLMKDLEESYLEYTTLLQAAHAMVGMNRPSKSEYTSVENFIDGEKPLVEEERSFIYCKEDLVTLRPGREHAWLDSAIEKVLRAFNCDLIEWMFCSNETKQKAPGKEHEVYYTRSRIEAAVNVIITFMILILLILPIYPLYHLTQGNQTEHSTAICIGILLVFTLAFSAVISFFTRARRHEILGASAAYCAVLVVFIGNVGSHSGN